MEPPKKPTIEEVELSKQLKIKFPEAEHFRLDWPLDVDFAVRSMPNIQTPDLPISLVADVVLGARYRIRPTAPNGLISGRNFTKWPQIVEALHQHGYSIAQIGLAESSIKLESDIKSWEQPNPSQVSFALLKRCRLFIGTDTGTTHLAAICGAPIICFRRNDKGEDMLNTFTRAMAKRNGSFFCFVNEAWDRPESVIREAIKFLS